MGTKRSGTGGHASGDDATERAAAFDTVRRGYHPEQVHTAVRELQWRLEMAEAARQDAEERVASLTVSLEAARASAPDTFGMRAEKILRMAEHESAQRRERAVQDADRIIDAAHDEAERLIAAARADAEQARTDAAAAVARLHADADEARRDTDLCADTAAAMHQHVIGLHGLVRSEVARLHAVMGAELHALDEMVANAPIAPATPPTVALPVQRPQPIRETTPERETAPSGAMTEPAGT